MATIYVKTTGNDSTGDGSSGNPYASPGKAAGVMSAGDTVDVSAGTYNITTTSTNVANGCISDGRTTGNNQWIGHGTVIFLANGISSCDLFHVNNGNYIYVENIIFDGANWANGITGFHVDGAYNKANGCTTKNCTYGFLVNNSESELYNCLATICNAGIRSDTGIRAAYCVSRNNYGRGFMGSSNYPMEYFNCIAYSNADGGFAGNYTVPGRRFKNCIAYGNTGNGFGTVVKGAILDGCIAWGNSGYGINGDGSIVCINCATGSNTSGGIHSAAINFNPISLTADPFTSASAGNFNLNTTAGGGAALRAATFSMLW